MQELIQKVLEKEKRMVDKFRPLSAILKMLYTEKQMEALLGEAQYVQSNTRVLEMETRKEDEFRHLSAILKMQ